MSAPLYSVRCARSTELESLQAIERAAARLFTQTRHPQMADAPLASAGIDPACDLVWVSADRSDAAVGFVIVRCFERAAHIQEIDVHPAHARRGLGASLIEHVARWASHEGMEILTLTTFDDVPWNGPYYSRLGFRVLDLDTLPEHLRSIRATETALQFPMRRRVCMQLDIAATDSAIEF